MTWFTLEMLSKLAKVGSKIAHVAPRFWFEKCRGYENVEDILERSEALRTSAREHIKTSEHINTFRVHENAFIRVHENVNQRDMRTLN